MNQKSRVQEFYQDKVVLVTGATGFVGKLLVEKLLRACPDVQTLYLLVREKHDCSVHERVNKILDSEIFKGLAEIFPKFRDKIKPIRSDLSESGLGLSSADRDIIRDQVNIVFHCAATLRFDEELKMALTVNMIGTKNVCQLSQYINKLEALIYVSTAYTNCQYSHIEEKVYPPVKSPEEIISIVNNSSNSKFDIDQVTLLLLDRQPNTYIYTKYMSEVIVNRYSGTLPVAILRPAIMTATNAEPLPGWVETITGATGAVVAVYIGLLKTMFFDYEATANIVPADMTVNAIIALAYCVGSKKQHLLIKNKNILDNKTTVPVVNYVMPRTNRFTWLKFTYYMEQNIREYPLSKMYWYPYMYKPRNYITYRIQQFFLYSVPTLPLKIIGGRTVKAFQKVSKIDKLLGYFCRQRWNFEERNMRALWDVLGDEDKILFPFDLETIDWSSYFSSYIQGVRKFILRDDPSTLPKARKNLIRWYYVDQLTKVVTLQWVPAHCGVPGNERADAVAKAASLMRPIYKDPFPLVYCKGLEEAHFRGVWTENWKAEPTGCHLFQFQPEPSSEDKFKGNSCPVATFAVRARTGHIVTEVYLFRFNLSESPVCTLCGGEEENIEHILFNCTYPILTRDILRAEVTKWQDMLLNKKLWALVINLSFIMNIRLSATLEAGCLCEEDDNRL